MGVISQQSCQWWHHLHSQWIMTIPNILESTIVRLFSSFLGMSQPCLSTLEGILQYQKISHDIVYYGILKYPIIFYNVYIYIYYRYYISYMTYYKYIYMYITSPFFHFRLPVSSRSSVRDTSTAFRSSSSSWKASDVDQLAGVYQPQWGDTLW